MSMKVMVFLFKGNVVLIVDKSTVKAEHSKVIGEMLQARIERDYPKDWESIDYHEGGRMNEHNFNYEWFGDNGILEVTYETFGVRDILQSTFSIIT